MLQKVLDYIIGTLLIAELLYLGWIAATILNSVFEIYEGIPLILLMFRLFLHVAIGVTAVFLFFSHKTEAKWAFLCYVAIAILERYWKIAPNSNEWSRKVEDMQRIVSQSVNTVQANVSVIVYPSWWMFALYFVVLVYVFSMRERYNKRIISN